MGRVGLFEFMTFDRELARVVSTRPDETEIQKLLAERNFPDLLNDSIGKLIAGVTSLEEIATVISPY